MMLLLCHISFDAKASYFLQDFSLWRVCDDTDQTNFLDFLCYVFVSN